ncbi:hypothetical protein OGAPHI_000699 [Ogataea philodendri]|uniref:Uncharacterized protein n=1 Tax=Ogataea philodendri TaxID=1378263 RepID=A0A9P8PEW3_9ASCO|nr:uncharacterized protein OGAPHI_000699 [Ogataea philodendri]KAH3670988.1 hypothetical protein OGAPHI_000699 [Ogataea philodendri]
MVGAVSGRDLCDKPDQLVLGQPAAGDRVRTHHRPSRVRRSRVELRDQPVVKPTHLVHLLVCQVNVQHQHVWQLLDAQHRLDCVHAVALLAEDVVLQRLVHGCFQVVQNGDPGNSRARNNVQVERVHRRGALVLKRAVRRPQQSVCWNPTDTVHVNRGFLVVQCQLVLGQTLGQKLGKQVCELALAAIVAGLAVRVQQPQLARLGKRTEQFLEVGSHHVSSVGLHEHVQQVPQFRKHTIVVPDIFRKSAHHKVENRRREPVQLDHCVCVRVVNVRFETSVLRVVVESKVEIVHSKLASSSLSLKNLGNLVSACFLVFNGRCFTCRLRGPNLSLLYGAIVNPSIVFESRRISGSICGGSLPTSNFKSDGQADRSIDSYRGSLIRLYGASVSKDKWFSGGMVSTSSVGLSGSWLSTAKFGGLIIWSDHKWSVCIASTKAKHSPVAEMSDIVRNDEMSAWYRWSLAGSQMSMKLIWPMLDTITATLGAFGWRCACNAPAGNAAGMPCVIFLRSNTFTNGSRTLEDMYWIGWLYSRVDDNTPFVRSIFTRFEFVPTSNSVCVLDVYAMAKNCVSGGDLTVPDPHDLVHGRGHHAVGSQKSHIGDCRRGCVGKERAGELLGPQVQVGHRKTVVVAARDHHGLPVSDGQIERLDRRLVDLLVDEQLVQFLHGSDRVCWLVHQRKTRLASPEPFVQLGNFVYGQMAVGGSYHHVDLVQHHKPNVEQTTTGVGVFH